MFSFNNHANNKDVKNLLIRITDIVNPYGLDFTRPNARNLHLQALASTSSQQGKGSSQSGSLAQTGSFGRVQTTTRPMIIAVQPRMNLVLTMINYHADHISIAPRNCHILLAPFCMR